MQVNAFHSGCIGDIIYSIPTIKALGATTLLVDDRPWTKPIVSRIGAFSRLLESQGILVRKHEGEHIDFDLSTYRNGGMRYGDNIATRVSRWMGVKVNLTKPWIHIEEKNPETKGKIIVSRGARWHGEFFPWKQIVEAYGEYMLFVGLSEEHQAFCNEFGTIPHLLTNDLYDVATAISGADLFIGNQSSPNSIAVGLGSTSIVETCLYAFDCIYERGNIKYVHDGNLNAQFYGKQCIIENTFPRNGWKCEIEGKTMRAKDRHICIALTRADCFLRKLQYSVEDIENRLKRY